MGDAVALNADRWIAEQHVVSRELAEEGAVALAQSNNRPMVLSRLATYLSREMIACATTLPMVPPFLSCAAAGRCAPRCRWEMTRPR